MQATTCRSASRCGSRAATRSTSTPDLRAARSRRGTPTASTGSPRSASGTTATPTTRSRIGDVHLTGGCGGARRRVLRHAARRCDQLHVRRHGRGQLGQRATTATNVPGELQVTRQRRRAPPAGRMASRRRVHVRDPGGALTANPGANPVTVDRRLGGHDHGRTTDRRRLPATAATNPCKYSVSRAGHQAFVGTTDERGRRRARAHIAASPWSGSRTRRFDNYATGRTDGNHGAPSTRRSGTGRAQDGRLHDAAPRRPAGEPDAPLRPELRTGPGVLDVPVRLQAVVRREPLQRRRQPDNTASWWNTSTKTARPTAQWFSYTRPRRRLRRQLDQQPLAMRAHRARLSTGQVGDDIAVATDNCDNINNNSCQTASTATTTATTTARVDAGWNTTGGGGSSRTRRLGVPAHHQPLHRALPGGKGLTGAGDDHPGPRLRLVLRHELDRRQQQPERPLPGHDMAATIRTSRHRRRPAAQSPASSSRRSITSQARSTRPRPATRESSRQCRATLVR